MKLSAVTTATAALTGMNSPTPHTTLGTGISVPEPVTVVHSSNFGWNIVKVPIPTAVSSVLVGTAPTSHLAVPTAGHATGKGPGNPDLRVEEQKLELAELEAELGHDLFLQQLAEYFVELADEDEEDDDNVEALLPYIKLTAPTTMATKVVRAVQTAAIEAEKPAPTPEQTAGSLVHWMKRQASCLDCFTGHGCGDCDW